MPALAAGRTVISDRFVDSSIAYQGGGRLLGEVVDRINAYAVRGCNPDLTFLQKIEPGAAEIRRSLCNNDRIENEDIAYHERVYEAFLALEKRHADRIVGIDATMSEAAISEEVIRRVDALLAGGHAGL
jgi:dTMP kinase